MTQRRGALRARRARAVCLGGGEDRRGPWNFGVIWVIWGQFGLFYAPAAAPGVVPQIWAARMEPRR